tara:strand:- start:646 stop:1236 length:591 start_codon:yes stop_codon:yes gene_type:complete
MKSLYFIRHGISQHNVLYHNLGKRVFYDPRYYDTKLTQEGVQQSILLSNTWRDIDKVELVLCSSLSRTLETARNIFVNMSVPIIALDILKEFPQGLQTCNKRREKRQLIEEYTEVDFTNVDETDTMWNPEREETIDELNQRIDQFNHFIKNRKETEIAIIGHNSFIGQYKDKKIGLIENGNDELLHCYPYKVNFKL